MFLKDMQVQVHVRHINQKRTEKEQYTGLKQRDQY